MEHLPSAPSLCFLTWLHSRGSHALDICLPSRTALLEVDGQTSSGFKKQWLYIRQHKYIRNSIIPKHKRALKKLFYADNESITEIEVQPNPSNIHTKFFSLTAQWVRILLLHPSIQMGTVQKEVANLLFVLLVPNKLCPTFSEQRPELRDIKRCARQLLTTKYAMNLQRRCTHQCMYCHLYYAHL